MAAVHEGKKYKCPICENSFTTTRYQKLHITSVHEGNKKWKCEHCNVSFAQKSALTRHIKAVYE